MTYRRLWIVLAVAWAASTALAYWLRKAPEESGALTTLSVALTPPKR